MRKIKITLSILIILTISLSLQSSTLLHRNEAKEVSFTYIPEYRIDTINYNGKYYISIVLKDGEILAEEGIPEIPLKHYSLAIGENADVQIEIKGKKVLKYLKGNILPAENIQNKKRILKDHDFKTSLSIKNIKKGYLRDVYTVSFDLCPIEYDQYSGSITMYEDIEIEVKSDRDYSPGRGKTTFDNIYKNTILNYKGANRTRKREIRKGRSHPTAIVKMAKKGIYGIGYTDILSCGIDPSFIDPNNIHIYSIGFNMMSLNGYDNDTLVEIPVYIKGEKDRAFGLNDTIFIYNDGLNGFNKNHVMSSYYAYYNPYTDTSSFVISFEDTPGIRMGVEYAGIQTDDSMAVIYDTLHLERENLNPSTSGYVWLDTKLEKLSSELYKDYPFQFSIESLENSIGDIYIKLYKSGNMNIAVFLNDKLVYGDTVSSERDLSFYPSVINFNIDNLTEGTNNLTIRLIGEGESQKHYLDYFEIYYNRKEMKKIENGQYILNSGEGNINIPFAGTLPFILNITDPYSCRILSGFNIENDTIKFKTDIMETYLISYKVLKPSEVKLTNIGSLKNTNGCDYLIIAADRFKNDLGWLESLRSNNIPGIDGAIIKTVSLSQIYDNFSGGRTDIAAIKKFLNHTYENWEPIPTYVMLVGAGSYDYKNHFRLVNPKNIIPVYEGGISVVEQGILTANASYDDWFVDFDNNFYADMIISRLPVKTTDDMENIKNKTEKFIENDGMWKNRIILLADDEYSGSNLHDISSTIQSENLSRLISNEYDIRKVYLMNYWGTSQTSEHWPVSPGEKPAARAALINDINKGVVGLTFVGHGNLNTIAHEHVISGLGQLDMLNNKDMYPVGGFYSCNIGNNDRALFDCIAEYIVNQKEKGCVATVAASRGTYANNNNQMSNYFNIYAFSDAEIIDRPYTIGESACISKWNSSSSANRLYNFFGEPAIIAYTNKIAITPFCPDTILTGHKTDITLDIDSIDKGIAYIEAFSSAYPDSHDYWHTEPYMYCHYTMPGAPVYRGPVSFDNSKLTFSFIYPYEFSGIGNMGRIIAYIISDSNTYHYSIDSIDILQGSKDTTDITGPDVEIYLNGIKAKKEDTIRISKDINIHSEIYDTSGVAIFGTQPVRLMIDNNQYNLINVSSNFMYNENSYTEGYFNYNVLFPDTGGIHTITVIASDNMLNITYKTVNVDIIGDDKISVENVLNWPNPLNDYTYFTFTVSRDVSVKIKIFTVTGKCIRTIEVDDLNAGYNQIYWDGKDICGKRPAQGLYFYKIILKDAEGSSRAVKSKLLIYR